MPYLHIVKPDVISLSLYIQPKATKTAFKGMHDKYLKLAVSIPPVDGKANKAVVAFLAKFFKIKKVAIQRKKDLLVEYRDL